MVIGFFLTPITLAFLGKEDYGFWLTLSSIITWLYYLDIGLGNGLRNMYAIALAKNDVKEARTLVSTSYFFLFVFSLFLFLLFLVVQGFISWPAVFNYTGPGEMIINKLVIIVFFTFLARFILQLINSILLAEQKTGLSSVILPVSNLIVLLAILYLDKKVSVQDNLIIAGTLISIVPVMVLAVFNLLLFFTTHRKIRPSVLFIRLSYLKNLVSLGVKFFFLQVASIALFSVSNIILIQLLDAASVTIYNAAIQLFSYLITFFMIVISPYWSAYTEAYHKNDIEWIRKSFRTMNKLWIFTSVFTLLVLVFSRQIIHLWLGNDISPSILLLVLTAIYVLLYTRMAIFNQFVNGIGEINLQLKIALVVTLVNIPMAVVFIKYLNMGMEGMMLSIVLCTLPYVIFIPRQVKKILREKQPVINS
jgi:O-antigen/teichoic acid export membrane protein